MAERFAQVVALLPDRLQKSVPELREEEKALVEEIRLRVGCPPSLTVANEVRRGNGPPVEQRELEYLLQTASKWSLHSVLDQLCGGYMTIEGGHRIGVTGTAVMDGPQVRTICDISSVNMRIARQLQGCAREIALRITGEHGLKSALIIAPPGGGKTTLLRDLIRILSGQGIRVSVADERGEVAAVWNGKPQMELGAADVLTGCPKARGIQILLRGMNPQVIAVDEITAPEDVQAMAHAAGCGVAVLATAHAQCAADLHRRPIYSMLMKTGLFEMLVTIRRNGGTRVIQVEDVQESLC